MRGADRGAKEDGIKRHRRGRDRGGESSEDGDPVGIRPAIAKDTRRVRRAETIAAGSGSIDRAEPTLIGEGDRARPGQKLRGTADVENLTARDGAGGKLKRVTQERAAGPTIGKRGGTGAADHAYVVP